MRVVSAAFDAMGAPHWRWITRVGVLLTGCAAAAAPAPRPPSPRPLEVPEVSLRVVQVSCEGAVLRAQGPPGASVRIEPATLIELTPPRSLKRDIEGTVSEEGFVDLRVPLSALDPGMTTVHAKLWGRQV